MVSGRPSIAGLLTAWTVWSAARPACAADFQLSWARGGGADECPSAGALRDEVARRLRRDPFVTGSARALDVVVQHDEQGWSAAVVERDPSGRTVGVRHLTSGAPGCDAIASAVALSLALLIESEDDAHDDAPQVAPRPAPSDMATPTHTATPSDTATASGTAMPSDTATPTHTATPPPGPPLPPAARRSVAAPLPPTAGAPPASRPRRLAARVGAALTTGVLPGLAVGAAWSARVELLEHVDASVGGWWLPESRRGPFGFGLTAGALGVCAAGLRWGPLAPSACVDLLAGSLHAVVYDLTPVHPGGRLWLAGALSPHLAWHFARGAFLDAAATALVPFTRHRFLVAGQTAPAYEEDSVGIGASFGVGMDIP